MVCTTMQGVLGGQLSNKINTMYIRVWKRGPDPVFQLLFHENPTSRTLFNSILNPVFFLKNAFKKSNFHIS